MPYPRSLQGFCLPEFYEPVPESWERRLREVSPVMDNLDHLVFRYFAPTNPDGSDRGWLHKDRGQWTLYTAKPIRLVDPERAEQFRLHWSELPEASPTQPEVRVGRRSVVSDYQHFMWHARGLYVRPFLILQGQWGGTPMKYTEQERAFLESSDCYAEPFPIGTFEACPFNEEVVKQIALRDRLLRVSNSYERLEQLDTSAGMKAEDNAALLVRRQTFLDTWKQIQAPTVDFLQHYMKRSEHREEFPAAPADLSNTLSTFKDTYLETGHWEKTAPASQRRSRKALSS
jgi:hypothetical protein